MIVLDASVLIAHLDADDPHHRRARDTLSVVGHHEFGASSLTLAEVLVGPARAGRLDAALAALTMMGVRELPLGSEAPARLARLRVESGLKLPDCCVLLAAQTTPGSIITFDERLERTAVQLGLA